MTTRLYLLPVLHLTDPVYNVPKYLPHRFNPALAGLEGVVWAWVTYLLEDAGLLIADVDDAQHTLLLGKADVIAVPPLDTTIGNATVRNRIRNILEAASIPADWVAVGMTYRQVVRTVICLFQFHNRAVARLLRRLWDGTINMEMTVSEIPAGTRDRLQETADELGLDYSGVTGSTTLRVLLKGMADQINNLLDPGFFRIDGAGLMLNL